MADDDRKAFLDRELRDEPELRAELEALLADAASASGFLVTRGEGEKGSAGASPAAGSTIGPYRILELLGEGGFGVVYLAEQTRPIRRRVALKLIKPGMDTKQVIARFEAERQALALMDHPGIAQVFDAGETEAGRPYFAMEHVPGIPITAFCDEERLRIRERLGLFLSVCDAVQHAHQRGVIHRDLKPTNVLVARRDGVATLKVIDFGIVKATSAAIEDRSFVTREGMVLGTPGYMSPEQIGAIESPVDTRSDIYSLGVVLYELLGGDLPFDRARLRKAAWTDAVRLIREEDPPPLAARAAQLETREIAARRSTDPRTLLRELRGELEWITLRTLERDPDRRYASASELAADIRRHLANEPVLAGAPSTMYRVRKLARKHRAAVIAAALVLSAVVTGGIAAGIGFGRAVRAERKAQREAESAQRVADFLVELFRTSSPDRSRGESLTVRTFLDEGARRIETALKEDPHVRARLLAVLGDVYLNLGLHAEGLALKREALETSEAAQPRDEQEIAGHLRGLAVGLRLASQPDSVTALLDRAIALLTRTDDEGALAACLAQKAAWFNDRGELDPADSLIALAIEVAESEPKPDSSQLMRMYNTKANIAHRRFELRDAERDYLHALELCEESGEEPTWSAALHRRLASLYGQLQDPERALSHAEEGVRLARQLYAADHPNLANALSGQAAALISKGDYEGAIAVREEALRILRARPENDDLLASELNSAGILYQATGKLALAIESTEEACMLNRRMYGSDNARTAETLANLARLYAEAGDVRRADSTFAAAIPVLDRVDAQSIFTVYAYMGLANLCRDSGRTSQADTLYAHAQAALDTTAGLRPYLGICLTDHAYLRSLQGRHAEAESLMKVGIAVQLRDEAEDSRGMGAQYVLWAAARARAGDADGAIAQLERAARCGVTADGASRYDELAALRNRPDYPLESTP
jgi:non-specific serine/threonine protein kinase/serine/threonine-protein kinase